MKKYSQEEQNQILQKLNLGIIGKRKQGTWDAIAKKKTITKTQCLESSSKHNKKSDWELANQSHYTSAQKNGWFEECTAHMTDGFKNWTKELVEETLNENFESYKEYLETYNNLAALKRLGMVDIVRSKLGVYDNRSLEELFIEAKKYTTKKEFNNTDNHAYQRLYTKGMLDEACSHMIEGKIGRPKGMIGGGRKKGSKVGEYKAKFTKEECFEAAKQVSSPGEFKEKFKQQYNTAQYKGWYNECKTYFKKTS